ncbi:hypothetical protein [Kibdelosporangium aridum]|uniref:DUF4367 domain-containing protein n=1 Tax=Kibdelosporangium aridum TaxID=2030 RepID=A0A1W2FZF7_KIBAR|nr:hypothetical protein [Kibdelosporangium aridum]SMD27243.1 hypothetical protein SAMN05661093_10844 [Kibdelosporangium aridum]
MTDDQLEAALRQLNIDVPEPPDVQAEVRARLSEPRRSVLRPILVAAAAVLLAFGLVFAVSPDVRAAVAEFLRFAGIEFRQDAPPPMPSIPMVPGERTISLAEARQLFDVKLPPALGEPVEVRVSDRVLSLLYNGKRLDEFEGDFRPAMAKFANEQDIEHLTVDGREVLWIPRPHEVLFINRHGRYQNESARMSGKTLIWQDGAVTLRLEGDFSKEEALRLAFG